MKIHAGYDGAEDHFHFYLPTDDGFIALCDGDSWDGEKRGDRFFGDHCKDCVDLYIQDSMGPSPRLELIPMYPSSSEP